MTVTQEKITKEMTIDEIFAKFPQKAQKLALVLSKAGLQCVGCCASTWETVESGTVKHGLNEEHLVQLLKDLNAVLEEPTAAADTITLTKRAAEKFKAIAEEDGKPGVALRFDEQPAGCNGFEHFLGFSEEATDSDVVFNSHGVEIHVHEETAPRLVGAEIDYVDGLQAGFKISNPNVQSSCKCGTSHGY